MTHSEHTHTHGKGCGHVALRHMGHTDYLHDGHLHNVRNDHDIEEHIIEVNSHNPDCCTAGHKCQWHDDKHKHGPGCGHASIPHGDHTDYIVEEHLHHVHSGHCDDHGKVTFV